MNRSTPLIIASSLLLVAACTGHGNMEYTNVAKYHPAWHSSAVDYDNTAQLITDGLVEDGSPSYYTMEVNGEEVLKENLAWIFDYRPFTAFKVDSPELELIVRFNNLDVAVDRLEFLSRGLGPDGQDAGTGGTVDIMVSGDGEEWIPLGESALAYSVSRELPREMSVKAIRIIGRGDFKTWEIRRLRLFRGGEELDIYKMIPFHNCWVSRGTSDEWVYVDLRGKTDFDRLAFHWINRPVSGAVLVSDDAANWRKIADYAGEDTLSVKGSARYVKLQMGAAADGGRLALSEMEIWGWREPEAVESDWWLVREDLKDIPDAWVPAKVPCTVLAAYIDAGMLPDPSYADNVCQISDSYFKYNFIYRGVMQAPESLDGRTWLNFDGVNWKADVKFNGEFVGHIDGAFIRSQFDVTGLIHDGPNDVEVLVYCPDNPSCAKGNTYKKEAYNGGILGADNPTFHASVGWDWIPTVRGRNIGIWNDVYFSQSGEVQLKDPCIATKLNLPDTTHASVSVSATLLNRSASPVTAQWKGSLGEHSFGPVAVMLGPGEGREVSALLEIDNPRLWWPNGYGAQNLYDVHMEAVVDGAVSDSDDFRTGLRENTYSVATGYLTVWVNGRRFSGRGGNWGFSEFNLRFREKEYDTAVRMHKEQNFTMIRDWVGQVMDDEFYEACDRYGIMVWQDFWLANPSDGPNPYDEKMFMDNADDLIKRIRNHPSIVLYVGRNEGEPPASLNSALAASVKRYAPGMYYIPDSSHGVVGGNGWYLRTPAYELFRMWGDRPLHWGQDRVHSEKGMPNVPNFESFVKFMPREHWWPQDDMWGVHDWALESAQRVGSFNDAVWSMFGEPKDAEQFCEWAQWVNFDGFRAIFECRSEQRRGLQLWMSHPAWPSFVFCTYDYYFDPTAAFFGCKKACEPLHVQWNPLKEVVEVVNISARDRACVTVKGEVLDMYGNVLHSHSQDIVSKEDSTVPCFGMEKPDRDVYYYRLTMLEGDTVVGDNFYVLGRETDNFKALHSLPVISLKKKVETVSPAGQDGLCEMKVTLENATDAPAMMVRLIAMAGGERILPVSYSDNFFHLMPGSSRTLTVTFDASALDGAKPEIIVKGFNLK